MVQNQRGFTPTRLPIAVEKNVSPDSPLESRSLFETFSEKSVIYMNFRKRTKEYFLKMTLNFSRKIVNQTYFYHLYFFWLNPRISGWLFEKFSTFIFQKNLLKKSQKHNVRDLPKELIWSAPKFSAGYFTRWEEQKFERVYFDVQGWLSTLYKSASFAL